MTMSKHIHTLLNGTIASLKTVIPMDIQIAKPSVTTEPYEQEELGVLIGIVGDLKGRLLLDTTSKTMQQVGEKMFGMAISSEMIESFTGELGNMIAGNICTTTESEGVKMDISPPTVMVGKTKLYGFWKALKLPVSLPEEGSITVLLTIDED